MKKLTYAAYAFSWTEMVPNSSDFQVHEFKTRGQYDNGKQVIMLADCRCGHIVTGKADSGDKKRALDRLRINWRYHIEQIKPRLLELQ